ncbi:MAG: YicC family protein [Gammaproteobacteria bacterium]|nr:YicC family protein [Gammaproteobacteria bacterium]
MTNSMTAFARNQAEFPWGSLIWEIRSVNHRYLEPAFRLPEQLRHIETGLRDILRSTISRGKVDAQLKFLPNVSGGNQIPINESLLEQLSQAVQKISTVTGSNETSPLDILKWPGIIQEKGQESKVIEEESLSLFKSTLSLLVEHRTREGNEMKAAIENRLDGITDILGDIRDCLPGILAAQQNKLKEQVSNLETEVDPERLEQELVLIVQKADIHEEIDRLDAHVKEVRHILSRKEPIGRRLDFLMQELNREANTICSKSIVTESTLNAVELKVLIEQMLEQIQNIE